MGVFPFPCPWEMLDQIQAKSFISVILIFKEDGCENVLTTAMIHESSMEIFLNRQSEDLTLCSRVNIH